MAGTNRTTKADNTKAEETKAEETKAATTKTTTGNEEVAKEEAAAPAVDPRQAKINEKVAKETDPRKARARLVRSVNTDTTGLAGTPVTPYEAVKDGKIVDSED